MDWRALLYVGIALVYVGYPIYYLTTQPAVGKMRMLGLVCIAYGITGVFLPDSGGVPIISLGALSAVIGFGVYFQVVESCFLWLLAMGYAVILLAWPEAVDPVLKFAGAIVLAAGFERCMHAVRVREALADEDPDSDALAH